MTRARSIGCCADEAGLLLVLGYTLYPRKPSILFRSNFTGSLDAELADGVEWQTILFAQGWLCRILSMIAGRVGKVIPKPYFVAVAMILTMHWFLGCCGRGHVSPFWLIGLQVLLLPLQARGTGPGKESDFSAPILYFPMLRGVVEFEVGGSGDLKPTEFV